MGSLAEKLTSPTFRETYAERKPYFELLNGEAVQKAIPTELHSILQFVLAVILKELGFKARPELTLAISESWEPVPDVCGVLGPEEDPYPTRAIAVAIEILSPDDRFTRVIQKCRRYFISALKFLTAVWPGCFRKLLQARENAGDQFVGQRVEFFFGAGCKTEAIASHAICRS